MPEAKKRTYSGVYDALNKVSQEEGIDFGLENYSPEDFKKKYFTGPGNISNLYNKLSKISDEEGVDFGLGTQDEWLASFGYRRRGDNDYETLDGKRVGGKSQQQVMSDAQQTLGENQRVINRIGNRQQRVGLDTGPRVQIGGSGWQLGQNRKVTQGQQRFNPSTGQMQQTYITPSGNEYGTRGLADLEQNARDIAERPQTVSNQLEEAYAERERLTQLMQQRIEQLEEGEDNRPWYLRMAGSASAADKMADGASPVNRWENDEEYIQLMAAARKNDELITTLEDRQKGNTNSFWHSLATDIANGYNFSLGGKAQMEDMRAMVDAQKHIDSINKKREKGEELTAEELTAEAFLKNAEWDQRVQSEYGDQYGAWARAGKMGAKSADFMLDFLMMGGAPISLARGVMNGVVKMGGEYAAKGFGKYMLKATGATLGSMVSGAMVTNTVQLGKTSNDVAQTMLGDVYTDPQGNYVFGHFDENGKFVNGGEDFLTSLAEVERAGIAENGSEVLGSFLPGADKILKGVGLSRIARGLTALKGKKWYANYSKFLKTSGFNGVPGEGLEEYGGTFLDFLMGGDEYKSLADLQTHVDIWLGVTTMGAMLNGPKMVGAGYSAIQHQRYKKATSAADIAAETTIGTDKWSQLRETIDSTPNEEMSDVVVNILNNNDLNDDAKRAAMEYVYNLQKMRGYSLGSVAADKNDDGSEEEGSTSAEINQSYTEGYDTQEPDDMKAIVDEADAARAELEQYGKEFAKMVEESDPVDGINYLLSLRDDFYTDEQIAAAADYYQKQYRAMGVMDGAADRVDLEVERANAEVRSNTHQQSGNVVTATVNDEEVYVIGGEIVTDPNTGLTALTGTGGAVVVKNQVTGQVSVKSPQEVVVQSVQNSDDLIQQNETTLRQQLVQQADDNITFGSPANEVYDMEDQVTFQDDNGNVVNGMVVQLPNAVDGAYIIQTDDNKILQMTADDLNRRIVAHNGMQVERASAQPAQQPAGEGAAQPAQQQGENAGGEAGAEKGTGADNPPASAISRIPVATDEKGQPILKKGRPQYLWHQVSVEDATDALIETTGGDKLMARDTAKDLIDVARDKLEKIRKQKPKGEDPIEIAESRMAIKQQETEQQAIIKQWQQVYQRIQNMMQEESAARQAAIEAAKSEEQRQREAEEARIAKERQDEQDRKRLREQIEKDRERRNKEYEPLVQARKDMADDAEALAILGDTEPRSLDEFVSSLLRPHSMLWLDASDSEIGLQTELGLKRNDMQRMMSLLGTKESGAKPFGQVVLDIHEGLPQGMKEMYTDADVRNTLLDLFNEGSSTRMLHLTEEHRIEEARGMYAENQRREAEAEMEAWAEAYHLTPEERETFEDYLQQQPSLPEQDIINQIIADNEQNRTSPAVGEQPVSGTAAGSIEGGEGQIQQAAEAAGNGDNAQAANQGAEAATGQPPVADDNVSGTARDREALAVLFDQIGASPILAGRMSDYDVEQLTAMVEDWEIANDEYGQVIEQKKSALKSKNKETREAAQKAIDDAQEQANAVFAPIEEYIEGLNVKYGIESEEPFEGAIPTPQIDKPRYDANRQALIEAYKSGDPAAITQAAQAIQQYVDEGLNAGEDKTEMFDIAEEYDGNDPEKLADQYIIRTFWDRYLDDDADKEYIKTGLKPSMRNDSNKAKANIKVALDALSSKYNSLAPFVTIDSRNLTDEEVRDIAGQELTPEEIEEGRELLRNTNTPALYSPFSKKIYIFADKFNPDEVEEWFFHENLHRGLEQYYGGNLIEIAEAFWNTVSPTNPEATAKHKASILEIYADKDEAAQHEEYLVHVLGHHMTTGSVERILQRLSPEHQEIIENILKNIKYDRATEAAARKQAQTVQLERGNEEDAHLQEGGGARGITSSPSEISTEEAKVDTNPTEAQKEAGNYQKGHIKVDGFDVTIENPKGSIRRGTDASGKQWEQEMHNTYGYIKGTEGVDGDHIDVFLSDNPASGKVWVVDQVNKDGSFDEHKVMYGFANVADATKAYLSNYEEGWQGLGSISGISREEFKKWIESSHRKTKPFRDYALAKSAEAKEKKSASKPTKEHKRIVSDEKMEDLRKQLLAKFNNMNEGIDVERMLLGAMYAVGKIERGVTKFADYAAQMVDEIGDAIRPYLKAFYNAVRDMPEAAPYRDQMDSAEYVDKFDVFNFDKQKQPTVFEKAEQVVKQQKAKKQVKKIIQEQPTLWDDMFAETESQPTEPKKEEPKQEPAKRKEPKLRPATEADLEGERPIVYLNGHPWNIIAVMHSGEQVSATQFSKPHVVGVVLTNGKSVKLSELMVEVKSDGKQQRKTAWWNDPNRPQSLAPSDYHTYTTDEAKAYFAQFKSEDGKTDFTKWAHPNLAYITAAAWDGAVIPVEELMQIAEIQEAENRVKEKDELPIFKISKQEHRELSERLLDAEHGSAVFENGKIKKVNDKEVFTGPVRQEKKAFVVVGRPAGGKSSVFANRLSHDNGARIVDSDVVKPWLSGYDEGYGAGYVQPVSAGIANSALTKASDAGDNIVLPRIGGSSVMKEVIMLREKGYDVQIFYNEVSEQTSIMRAASRFAQEGRYLSLDYLTQIEDKDSKSFRTFVGKKIGDYYVKNQQTRRSDEGSAERPLLLVGRSVLNGRPGQDGRGTGADVSGLVSDGRSSELSEGRRPEEAAGTFEEELIFSYAEWKSNDVAFGEKPKEIWNSKSGKPMPAIKTKNDGVQSEQRLSGEPSSSGEGKREDRGAADGDRAGLGSEPNRTEHVRSEHSVDHTSRVPDEGEETRDSSRGPGRRSGDNARVSTTTLHNNKRNNSGERGKDYAPTSPKARFNANVEAIKMMRELIDQGIEAPTKDQMEVQEEHYQEQEEMDSILDGIYEMEGLEFRDEFADAFEIYDGDLTIRDEEAAIRLYNRENVYQSPLDWDGYVIDEDTEDTLLEWAQDVVDRANTRTKEINQTRLKFTTAGLENKREIALTVPIIQPYRQDDDIHFGDAGGGRAVAWVRFGEISMNDAGAVYDNHDSFILAMQRKYGAEGPALRKKMTDEEKRQEDELLAGIKPNTPKTRVLVIDEIQSKRHQDGRDKGYIRKSNYVAENEVEKSIKDYIEYCMANGDSLNTAIGYAYNQITDAPEESKGWTHSAVEKVGNAMIEEGLGSVPDAPFDKNWQELAMKRMLRYAAENGYDKVAWTTGAQQSERYNIGSRVRSIDAGIDQNGNRVMLIYQAEGGTIDITYDDEGNIKSMNKIGQNALGEAKNIRDIVGKEIAVKALSIQGKGTENMKSWKGDGLRIGAEGMKGFYDEMLVRFMNKYGKKWGVQVSQTELPGINKTMWSIDVTPEMKTSVMLGQPMFRDADVFAEGESFPINTTMGYSSFNVLGTSATYSTELMPDAYTSHEEMLDAIRRQYPAYYARIEDGQVVMESWQHVFGAADAARQRKDKGSKSYVERKTRNAINAVQSLAKQMHLDVEVLTTTDGLTERQAQAKGWFNQKNGKITLVLPNHSSQGDLINTLLHEGVAHYGLRNMFGQHFDTFLDNVYNNVSPEIKARIDATVKSKKCDRHEATEEYLARLAERTDFENASKMGWWQKIKEFFMNMLANVGLVMDEPLTDNELRYILWRSYDNLLHPDRRRNIFDKAREVSIQSRLRVGPYSERERQRIQRTGRIDTSRIASAADRVNEEMLNPDFEGKSSQELLLSLSQKDENGRNETINELVRRVREGEARIVRMGQEVGSERANDAQIAGTILGGWQQLRLSEPSDDLLGGMVQSLSPVEGRQVSTGENTSPNIKLAIISWARATGHYISEEQVKEASPDKAMYGFGFESNVYRTPDGKKVIKFITAEDEYYQNPLLKRMDGIEIFNAAGFEPVTVLGYSLDTKNRLRVVVEQNFVDGVSVDDIFDDEPNIRKYNYLDTFVEEELGLIRHMDAEGNLFHMKDGIIYKDIHGGNVIVDKNNKHHVIDCYVSRDGDDRKERADGFSIEDKNIRYSIRTKKAPKKTGTGYKVFVLKDGELYPPMVANPNGEGTPVGVWLDADAAPVAGTSKTGRPQVKAGGKGTQGGSGQLAYRPGWHLGTIPYALQFGRKDANGERTLFPNNFVWAEVEYADDVDYQDEARQEGVNANGKYQHSLAGLKHVPTDGSYKYRTNPDPRTDEWVITGAMRIKKILTRAEVDELVRKAGREPQKIQDGDVVTDDVVKELNDEIKATMEADEMRLLYRDGDAWVDDVAKDAYEKAVAQDGVKLKEAWQDSMVALKLIQNAIAKETGRVATGAEDAYNFENRMHGRAKNMTEQYDWNYYRPMLKAFADFCKEHRYIQEQGLDYLISKSGLERNMYYAMQAAVKDKLAEDAKQQREQLEKDYAKGRIPEQHYKDRKAEIEDLENNGVDDAIKDIKDKFLWKKAQEDYDNGEIDFGELLRRREMVIASVAPKYTEYAHDYSGLTETFAKDMYDSAQNIKKKAQRAIDPQERRMLWREYDEAMRHAYEVAREYALDAVFIGEDGKYREPSRKLWATINAATEETLKHNYESGLMDRKTYNKVREMFDYYIPLRGWDEDKASDVYTYMGKDNVFSPAVKKTWGRTSKAENPLAYIGNIAVSTIIAGHRNLMKQHFLNYVMNNPTSLVSISESWYENIGSEDDHPVWILRSADTAGKSGDELAQIVNDFNEEMRLKQREGKAMPVRGRLRLDVHATSGQKNEHVVEVQRAGRTYQLYINGNPKAAQALNGSAARAVSRISDTWWGKKITKLNRNMAMFFTSKNPAFVVSNLSRDLNMAGASVAINEGAKYNAQFVANVIKVLAPRMGESSKWMPASKQPTGLMPSLMRKWQNGTLDESNETERLFKEFMTEGGETGFVNMLSIDSFKEKMQKEIREMNGSSLFGGKSSVKETSIHKGLRLLGDTFEFYNRCAEDATRFIVYMTSRQMGKTLEESIADAKNVTLNFNRKGTGALGNAEARDLFIFVNPAIQALANMYRMAKGHPLKLGGVAAGFMLTGMFMPVFNQWLLNMFGDDDDKDAYWNLPPWVRKNNLVFWVPGTKYFFTMPLAQEFRVFYGVGEMISSGIMEHPHKNTGIEIVESVADLVPINPIGNGGNLVINFLPTTTQPILQIAFNKDFTGKPIWKDNKGNKYDPMFTKAYASTPKWMVKLSEAINSVTGGDKDSRGWIEKTTPGYYLNNPAVWNHLLQGYLGGMYNTIAKTADLVVSAARQEVPNMYQVPVMNRFVNSPWERDNNGILGEDYWQLINDNEEFLHNLRAKKKRAEAGDADAKKKLEELEKSDEYKTSLVIASYKRLIDGLREQEKETSDKEELARIKVSLSSYKNDLLDELAAVRKGEDPLKMAMTNFDNSDDPERRSAIASRISKEVGATKDPYGKKSKSKMASDYQKLRTAEDVREDALLFSYQEKADAEGNEELAEKISKERESVRRNASTYYGLGKPYGRDENAMNYIRRWRKKLLEKYAPSKKSDSKQSPINPDEVERYE